MTDAQGRTDKDIFSPYRKEKDLSRHVAADEVCMCQYVCRFVFMFRDGLQGRMCCLWRCGRLTALTLGEGSGCFYVMITRWKLDLGHDMNRRLHFFTRRNLRLVDVFFQILRRAEPSARPTGLTGILGKAFILEKVLSFLGGGGGGGMSIVLPNLVAHHNFPSASLFKERPT